MIFMCIRIFLYKYAFCYTWYIDYIYICVWIIQVVTQPDVSFCKIVLGRKSLRISTSGIWSWVNEMVCNSTQPCMIFIFLVVVSNMFYVHPYLGKWSNSTNIFQTGWNHQRVYTCLIFLIHKLIHQESVQAYPIILIQLSTYWVALWIVQSNIRNPILLKDPL